MFACPAPVVNRPSSAARSGRKLLKQKGRKQDWSFLAVPHQVMDSPNWARCSGTAIKLLFELARQFKGRNNGDLSAALSKLRSRGWSSPETLTNAYRELLHYGLVVLTRQGGLHACSLYALSWLPINECGGKLDCNATNVPPGNWKQPVTERYKRPQKKRGTPSTSNSAPRSSVPGFVAGVPTTLSVANAAETACTVDPPAMLRRRAAG